MSDTANIEPLPVEGVVDYHCHCDYSVDATGTIDDFCEAAIKRNLAEICFTTHFDSNPNSDGDIEYIRVNGKDLPVTVENLQPYVDDVHRAADRYYSRGLSVKLGLEVGWYEGVEEKVQKLRERYDFHYILCGIHELEDICFCCEDNYLKCFDRYTPQQTAEVYFRQVKLAAATGLFDSIAHLAYYLRSGIDYYGDVIRAAHEPFMDEVFRALKSTGTGLEVNTSGIRHGLGDYYPTVAIINAARKAGVEVNFLGSDAHRPDQLGFDFEAAMALVPDNIRGCED